jgi:hypothetical protein
MDEVRARAASLLDLLEGMGVDVSEPGLDVPPLREEDRDTLNLLAAIAGSPAAEEEEEEEEESEEEEEAPAAAPTTAAPTTAAPTTAASTTFNDEANGETNGKGYPEDNDDVASLDCDTLPLDC